MTPRTLPSFQVEILFNRSIAELYPSLWLLKQRFKSLIHWQPDIMTPSTVSPAQKALTHGRFAFGTAQWTPHLDEALSKSVCPSLNPLSSQFWACSSTRMVLPFIHHSNPKAWASPLTPSLLQQSLRLSSNAASLYPRYRRKSVCFSPTSLLVSLKSSLPSSRF